MPGRILLVLGLVVAGLVPASRAGAGVLFQKDSFYHRIRVEEDAEARSLYFDRTLQSAMTLRDPVALRLVYSRYLSLGLAFTPAPRRLLLIGLGGASLPKRYRKDLPALDMDVAEIDPEVIEVARKYFGFAEDGSLRVHAQDGRLFLAKTARRFDVILLDAYSNDAIPFHLTTREFFSLADRHLTPGGVFAVNVIGAVTGASGRITRSIARTLREVFPRVYLFASRRPAGVGLDSIQNVIIVGTKEDRKADLAEVVRRAAAIGRDLFPDPIEDIAASYLDEALPDDVPVLTDDYAPTDRLLNPGSSRRLQR